MALLQQNRIFGSRGSKVPRDSAAGFMAWVLVGVSVALLAAGWIEPGLFEVWRGRLAGGVAPIVSAASVVMEPVNRGWAWASGSLAALREAGELRAVTARLAETAARADDLARENEDLRKLARFAGAPGIPRVSARVVARSPGGLSRTLLIGAGRDQGIRDGFVVVGGDGLLGRVVQTNDGSASVMLLSDRLSRVPVYIGKAQVRGVLAGTGAGWPRLEFVPGGVAISEGDLVTTSGLGGVFPRGLLAGIVTADGSGWRVQPTADETPFTVGVLQVEIPASDLGEAPPPLKRAERETAGSRLKAIVK